MFVGKILRSTRPHAIVKNILTKKALELPGVMAVITGEDIPRNRGAIGLTIYDQPILAQEKVRYVGEPIAAVAAVDEQTAEEALNRIEVSYEDLPCILDVVQARRHEAPEIHAGVRRNVAKVLKWTTGDIEEALQRADHVFDDTFENQSLIAAPLEPHGAVALWDDDVLTCWDSTQLPNWDRAIISRALGIPYHKVRVISRAVGGGFGSKLLTPTAYIAAALARKLGPGRAVKIINTRAEDLSAVQVDCFKGFRIRTGVNSDGTIIARMGQFTWNIGAYVYNGETTALCAASNFLGLYRCEHLHCEVELVYTNLPPAGGYRGYGAPAGVFAVEQQIDMICRTLGFDPVEFRLKNVEAKGDTFLGILGGPTIESCGISECLQELKHKRVWTGWSSEKSKSSQNATSEKLRGVGVAIAGRGCGWRVGYKTPEEAYEANPSSTLVVRDEECIRWKDNNIPRLDTDASSCLLRVNQDGTIEACLGGEIDFGQGLETVMAQIVAEEMGIRPEAVTVVTGDTGSGAYGLGVGGSRETTIAGMAAKKAATDVKRQLFERVAGELGVSPEVLVMREGKIFNPVCPDKFVTYEDAVWRSYVMKNGGYLIGKGYHDHPTSTLDAEFCAKIYVAQIAEVEVDKRTGAVEVKRIISNQDSGTIINPMLAESQVYGGICQGVGRALLEEIVFEDGRVLNPGFLGYKIPGAVDMTTEIEVKFINTFEPHGPFGAKAVAEFAAIPIAAAIANAVSDAIGVRLKKLPITPEDILLALSSRQQ
jgi:CO/xanthine dehydrogenase Mo-binding subunit